MNPYTAGSGIELSSGEFSIGQQVKQSSQPKFAGLIIATDPTETLDSRQLYVPHVNHTNDNINNNNRVNLLDVLVASTFKHESKCDW